jgi:hypothetical protein
VIAHHPFASALEAKDQSNNLLEGNSTLRSQNRLHLRNRRQMVTQKRKEDANQKCLQAKKKDVAVWEAASKRKTKRRLMTVTETVTSVCAPI